MKYWCCSQIYYDGRFKQTDKGIVACILLWWVSLYPKQKTLAFLGVIFLTFFSSAPRLYNLDITRPWHARHKVTCLYNNSAEFLCNDPLSSLLGWSLHKNGRLHEGRLNNLNTSFFYGSSNQALWNIHTVVLPSGIDTEWETSQEFLPPPTQLITKCKIRTKNTRKIKRSKQSHSYYPNSVATDRLVLAGDEKSVQNIAVKKSCVTCNKTIRLNQKELTCNLCSGSFHYKCKEGKLKLDVNLWNVWTSAATWFLFWLGYRAN